MATRWPYEDAEESTLKISCVHIVHCDVQEAGQAVPRYAVIVERQKRSQNEKESKGDPS